MGVRSTVTIGSNSAEVNGTYAACDSFCTLSFSKGPRWTALSPDRRKSAQIEATRILDGLYWSSATQALIDADTPPDDLVEATYWLALNLAANPNLMAGQSGGQGAVRSVSASSRRVDFYNTQTNQDGGAWSIGLPAEVVRLVTPLMGNPGDDLSGISSGTDGVSVFTDDVKYSIDSDAGSREP